MSNEVLYTDLSKWGLIREINEKVLHPLGLAMSWNPDNGTSEAILVADDLVYEYASIIRDTPNYELEYFKENREEILTKILGD